MKQKSRFNLLYEQIMNSFDSSTLDMSKFNFRQDEDGNIICTFKMNRDNYELSVIAKQMNGNLSFNVSNAEGKSQELSEKKFAVIYSLDYDEFKKALGKFTSLKTNQNISDVDESKIKSFNSQVNDNENPSDENVKMTKMLEVEGYTFMFNMLNDQAVDNYCECTFEVQNEDTSEISYYKALLDIKIKNSLIIKIVVMDVDGKMKDIIAGSDLETDRPDIFRKFKLAIKKMEKIIWDR